MSAPDASRADAALLPVTVLIVAKAPVAGYAKTRLTPPLTPVQAAQVAAAALLDTLDAVRDCPVAHRVVAFTGDLDAAERGAEISGELADFEMVPQRGTGFGVRLANAHADAARPGLPVLQIGMDTPQLGSRVLADAARALVAGADALLGPATDGGWWGLGLSDPRAARLLAEVPMSTPRTGEHTRGALRTSGYRVELLPTFTDVDHFADAVRVAADCSGRFAADCSGRFAAAVGALDAGRVAR
ncbi:TIGR04282 family arsenosugar biosynthesis glycosyltransferase [Nocardia sp. NBC_00416]|uniref:TIGR04282 family arsenosugar biosynthesis glycosyltransferase n=1 Tax=Nocardia sp. NBC_00416 TaxID=2975991 RepID=UPI002E1FDCB0